MIHPRDKDATAVVRDLPASPAARRVPPGNRLDSSDVRERRQRAEGAEALGDEAVRAIGAGDVREGFVGVVISLVVADVSGERCRCENGEGCEGERELHCRGTEGCRGQT